MTKDEDVSWFTSGRPLTRRRFNGLGGVTLTREAPRAQLTDTMNRAMLLTHIHATGSQFATDYPPVVVESLMVSGLPVNMGNAYAPISVFSGSTGFALGVPRVVMTGQPIVMGVRLADGFDGPVHASAGIVGFEVWPDGHEVDPLSRVLHETKDPDEAAELANYLARAAKDWKAQRETK